MISRCFCSICVLANTEIPKYRSLTQQPYVLCIIEQIFYIKLTSHFNLIKNQTMESHYLISIRIVSLVIYHQHSGDNFTSTTIYSFHMNFKPYPFYETKTFVLQFSITTTSYVVISVAMQIGTSYWYLFQIINNCLSDCCWKISLLCLSIFLSYCLFDHIELLFTSFCRSVTDTNTMNSSLDRCPMKDVCFPFHSNIPSALHMCNISSKLLYDKNLLMHLFSL